MPTLNNDFGLSIKLDSMKRLTVKVTKKAFFPSAEREKSHWGCNANVDPYISSQSIVSEFPCSSSATGKYACRITIAASVDKLY